MRLNLKYCKIVASTVPVKGSKALNLHIQWKWFIRVPCRVSFKTKMQSDRCKREGKKSYGLDDRQIPARYKGKSKKIRQLL